MAYSRETSFPVDPMDYDWFDWLNPASIDEVLGLAEASSIPGGANSMTTDPLDITDQTNNAPINVTQPLETDDRRPLKLVEPYSMENASPLQGENRTLNREFRGMSELVQDPERPRNERDLVCNYAGCENVVFEKRTEFKKHMDRHERPYKCTVRKCTAAFTSKGDQRRHERTVHRLSEHGKHTSFYCHDPACDRSKRGFPRKDNRDQHVRRRHGKTDSVVTSTPSDIQYIPSQSSTSNNTPSDSSSSDGQERKRRRVDDCTLLPPRIADRGNSEDKDADWLKKKMTELEQKEEELKREGQATRDEMEIYAALLKRVKNA